MAKRRPFTSSSFSALESFFSASSNLSASERVAQRRFAQSAAPTLSADAADHQSKAAEYTRLARELERRYHAHAAQASAASGATLDWDGGLSPGRGGYLTHGGPADR